MIALANRLPSAPLAHELHPRHFVDQLHELRSREIAAGFFQPRRDVSPKPFDSGVGVLLEEIRSFWGLARSSHAERGRCTVNVVPRSSDDSTSIRPLWAWTIWSAMYSPKPRLADCPSGPAIPCRFIALKMPSS